MIDLKMIDLSEWLKSQVPEADGIKDSREGEPPAFRGALNFGEAPVFKRKKSFWRALRRGEMWAIYPMSMQNLQNKLAAEMFGGVIPPSNWLTDANVPSDIMYLIRKNTNGT